MHNIEAMIFPEQCLASNSLTLQRRIFLKLNYTVARHQMFWRLSITRFNHVNASLSWMKRSSTYSQSSTNILFSSKKRNIKCESFVFKDEQKKQMLKEMYEKEEQWFLSLFFVVCAIENSPIFLASYNHEENIFVTHDIRRQDSFFDRIWKPQQWTSFSGQ